MNVPVWRVGLIALCAWVSACLLIAGWWPHADAEMQFVWLISGLTGLVSCVGLAQVIKNEITTQRELIDEYMQAAMSDGLTKLANRQALDKALDAIFKVYDPQSSPVSLIMLDIDHFKKFNDQHGHQAGDQVLQSVSHAAVHHFFERGCVARYGGEEFAVLLPNTRIERANQLADEFRDVVRQLDLRYHGYRLGITISLGVAQAMSDDCPETFVRRADDALYTAKRLGRNRTCSNEYQALSHLLPIPQVRADAPVSLKLVSSVDPPCAR